MLRVKNKRVKARPSEVEKKKGRLQSNCPFIFTSDGDNKLFLE